MTPDHKIHVSRNGSLLGTYDSDQLADLLERGDLQKTDYFYDDSRQDWVALSEWTDTSPSGGFRKAETVDHSDDGSRRKGGSSRGGRSSRSKNKGGQPAIAGWIACLFSLGAAAGIWAYASTLQDRLRLKEREIKELNETIGTLNRKNQMTNEITPPGRIRAIITYEPGPGQVAIMSGATVGLYSRADAEAAIAQLAASERSVGSAEAFEQGVAQLRQTMATPLAVSLTDSNGRVDLAVPDTGDYVLLASAGKTVEGKMERFLWMVGIRGSNEPTRLLMLDEKSAISLLNPDFQITDVPSMVSIGGRKATDPAEGGQSPVSPAPPDAE